MKEKVHLTCSVGINFLMGSGPSLPCQTFSFPAPHSRPLDLPPELRVVNHKQPQRLVPDLVPGHGNDSSPGEQSALHHCQEKDTEFEGGKTCLVWLQPLPECAHISQISRFCILAGIPRVNLPRSAFSSTAPLPAPISECFPSCNSTFSILFYADPIFLLILLGIKRDFWQLSIGWQTPPLNLVKNKMWK